MTIPDTRPAGAGTAGCTAVWRVSKVFRFEAAHHLPHLPEGHRCRRPHGHSYVVELHLAAPELDGRGFVLDYGELDPFRRWLESELDHRDLNVVMGDVATSAENIAAWLYRVATDLVLAEHPAVMLEQVVVRETASTAAAYVHAAAPGG